MIRFPYILFRSNFMIDTEHGRHGVNQRNDNLEDVHFVAGRDFV